MKMTRHAEKRMKQRNGLGRKSAARIAAIAMQNGLSREDARGTVRVWMDKRYDAHDGISDNLRIYGDKLYVFCDDVLVTVIQVPSELSSKVKIQSEKIRKVC